MPIFKEDTEHAALQAFSKILPKRFTSLRNTLMYQEHIKRPALSLSS
jgi:hypothetical protein